MSPENKQETKLEKQPSDFKSELDSILNSPLTPENIDHYADGALEKIINLTDRVLGVYGSQTGDYTNNAEVENAAYEHYQLGDINSLLDYISEKDKDINNINNIIAKAAQVDDVITPPEVVAAMKILGSDGTFEKPSMIPRLKTLIFILENEFDVKLDDPRQFKLTKGILRDNMMRRESYYEVETPTLERTTLVCDEGGNATFVFDSEKLRQYSISSNDLTGLTKNDIKDLLEENPDLGQRIIYSNQFVPDMIKAYVHIKERFGNESEDNTNSADIGVSYLRPKAPKAPEGYYSTASLAKALGVDSGVIKKAFIALGDEVGSTKTYRFYSNNAIGVSPEQRIKIEKYLIEHELIAPKVPEGNYSIMGLSKEFGVAYGTLKKTFLALENELGPTKVYRFGNRLAIGLSPEQCQKIDNYLVERGIIAPQAPEEYYSPTGLARELGVDGNSVAKALLALKGELGLSKIYRYNKKSAIGLSPEQCQKIDNYLVEREIIAPQAPEGYRSITSLAKELRVDYRTLKKTFLALEDKLNPTKVYKFGSRSYIGLSPEQQQIIRSYIDAHH